MSSQVVRFFERPIAALRRWTFRLLVSEMTPERLAAIHPATFHAVAHQGAMHGITEGARQERERVRAIYELSAMRIDSLIERYMWDGVTTAEGAAMSWIASMRTRNTVASEAASIEQRGGSAHVQ
jgi:hypothetical protein